MCSMCRLLTSQSCMCMRICVACVRIWQHDRTDERKRGLGKRASSRCGRVASLARSLLWKHFLLLYYCRCQSIHDGGWQTLYYMHELAAISVQADLAGFVRMHAVSFCVENHAGVGECRELGWPTFSRRYNSLHAAIKND